MKDKLGAKIQQIKDAQQKLSNLLDEYKTIHESKGKLYHLKVDSIEMSGEKKYYLVQMDTKKVVCYGNIERLKSFLNIRKIKIENIFSNCADTMHTIGIFLNCD
jgi:hypothetical protein